MSEIDLDIYVFAEAKGFLLSFEEVEEEDLEAHIYINMSKPTNLNDIYKRILESSQNASMHPEVIRSVIGSIDNLSELLFDFDPHQIVQIYPHDSSANVGKLYEQFSLAFNYKRKYDNKGILSHLCKTIISSAHFINKFTDADSFYLWVGKFYNDETLRPALPVYLNYEIFGLDIALSCDFLKDLGYVEFAKPNVHLKQILCQLGLSSDESDRTTINAISRIALNNDVSPYTVEKLFWLVVCGQFYLSDIKIGSQKDKFILKIQSELNFDKAKN